MGKDTEQYGVITSEGLPESHHEAIVLSLTSGDVNQEKVDTLLNAIQWLYVNGYSQVKGYIRVSSKEEQASVEGMLGSETSNERMLIEVSVAPLTESQGKVVYLLGMCDQESYFPNLSAGEEPVYIRMNFEGSLFSPGAEASFDFAWGQDDIEEIKEKLQKHITQLDGEVSSCFSFSKGNNRIKRKEAKKAFLELFKEELVKYVLGAGINANECFDNLMKDKTEDQKKEILGRDWAFWGTSRTQQALVDAGVSDDKLDVSSLSR